MSGRVGSSSHVNLGFGSLKKRKVDTPSSKASEDLPVTHGTTFRLQDFIEVKPDDFLPPKTPPVSSTIKMGQTPGGRKVAYDISTTFATGGAKNAYVAYIIGEDGKVQPSIVCTPLKDKESSDSTTEKRMSNCKYGYARPTVTASSPNVEKTVSPKGVTGNKLAEYLDNSDLSTLSKRYFTLELMYKFAKELVKLHKGLTHQNDYADDTTTQGSLNLDIKLENMIVLVEETGNDEVVTVKLIDLDDVPDANLDSVSGRMVSYDSVRPFYTVAYASPEVIAKTDIDCIGLTDKADVFSFGRVLAMDCAFLVDNPSFTGFHTTMIDQDPEKRPTMEDVVTKLLGEMNAMLSKGPIKKKVEADKRNFVSLIKNHLEIKDVSELEKMLSKCSVEAVTSIKEQRLNEMKEMDEENGDFSIMSKPMDIEDGGADGYSNMFEPF